MTKTFVNPLIFLLLALSVFSLAATAQAETTAELIAKAKIDRIIGERSDGYIGTVSNTASAAIVRAVRETNIKRKAVYGDLARSRGASIEVVAALTGEKLIARTPSGQMIMNAAGVWSQVK